MNRGRSIIYVVVVSRFEVALEFLEVDLVNENGLEVLGQISQLVLYFFCHFAHHRRETLLDFGTGFVQVTDDLLDIDDDLPVDGLEL